MPKNHIIVCSCLLLLLLPVYVLDSQLLKGKGGDWISLDLRGLFIWSYVAFLTVHIGLSTLAVSYYKHSNLFLLHIGSVVLTIVILIIGVWLFRNL
jgi:hypothetical protein